MDFALTIRAHNRPHHNKLANRDSLRSGNFREIGGDWLLSRVGLAQGGRYHRTQTIRDRAATHGALIRAGLTKRVESRRQSVEKAMLAIKS